MKQEFNSLTDLKISSSLNKIPMKRDPSMKQHLNPDLPLNSPNILKPKPSKEGRLLNKTAHKTEMAETEYILDNDSAE